MTSKRGPLGKLIDAVRDGVADVIGQLAPQPDRIPVPVRDDPRRR